MSYANVITPSADSDSFVASVLFPKIGLLFFIVQDYYLPAYKQHDVCNIISSTKNNNNK